MSSDCDFSYFSCFSFENSVNFCRDVLGSVVGREAAVIGSNSVTDHERIASQITAVNENSEKSATSNLHRLVFRSF